MPYKNKRPSGIAAIWMAMAMTLLIVWGCSSAPPMLSEDERTARRAVYTDGERVENFALLDAQGNFHELHRYGDAKAIVLYVQGNGCPIVRHGATDYRKVAEEFGPEGVRFFMINATGRDSREEIRREAEEFRFPTPVLVDEQRIVSDALELNRTAEVLVIEPASWRVVYRGRINDRMHYEAQKPEATENDLANALNDVLAARPVARSDVPSPGCAIASKPVPTPTYTADIAPILERNCVMCHREGGAAPWAMTGYDMVRGWAPMIRQVVRTKRMPPWHADPHVGDDLRGDLSLPSEDARALVDWAEAGAPRGEGEDPLAQLELAPLQEWRLGPPDQVVTLDEQRIPATGLVPYRYAYLELELDEDLWINGIEFQPGNPAVLHHALGYVVPPGADDYNWVDGVMITYAPGNGQELAPSGSARFVPKGSKVFLELHYVTTGREELDQSRVGLHFADEPPERVFRTTGGFDLFFEIPPGARNFEVANEVTFDEPVVVYSLTPHMHYRGDSMEYVVVYPDGRREPLLSVPNYDFNWQRPYQLEEPKPLPAGSRIEVSGTFDNSAQNRFNPNPNQWLRFGPQTKDEMFIGYITYTYANAADDRAHSDRDHPLLWFPVPDGKGNGGAAAFQ